jgi:hypothetical protein
VDFIYSVNKQGNCGQRTLWLLFLSNYSIFF